LHVGFSLLTLFPGRVGGSESYARGLLEAFAAGAGPGRVTVLANRHVMAAYGAYRRGPLDLQEVASYAPGDSLVTRALAMAAARLAPARAARSAPQTLDLVHYAVTVPIPALPLPTVVTVHDVSHLDRRDPASWPLRRYRRWAYDGAARSADVVVATSAFARERIVEGMGVGAERIEVVAPGIDHHTFAPGPRPDDEALLSALTLPDRFLLYPANLWPHKNHARLLDALACVADRELHLVLAGQTYGRGRRLAAQARRLGLGDRVRHVGQVDPAVLAALYRRAEAVVIPSLHEGFGFPALEAMACGCPVASSGRGGLGEASGEATLGFDPEQPAQIAGAIDQLVDGQRRDRLVAAGLRLAAGYTWQAAAERHLEVYRRACRGA
jgi:glycosyltransferase involved in cell wall biosynthesis